MDGWYLKECNLLTETDYCDKDLTAALKDLGFPTKMVFIGEQATIEIPINSGLIKLYEAQKWLRKEKHIIVYPEKNSFGWFCATHYNIGKVHRFKYSEEYYDSYEEALSEGIKVAVKILKEDETIHE